MLSKQALFPQAIFQATLVLLKELKQAKYTKFTTGNRIRYLEDHQIPQVNKLNHPTLIWQTCTFSSHFTSLFPSSQSTSNATMQSPLPTPPQHHPSKEELCLLPQATQWRRNHSTETGQIPLQTPWIRQQRGICISPPSWIHPWHGTSPLCPYLHPNPYK
jgi:hypothetical protein